MATPSNWRPEYDVCECGALLDADGECPYCTASLGGRHCGGCDALLLAHESECSSCLNAEYWSWFDLFDIVEGNEE